MAVRLNSAPGWGPTLARRAEHHFKRELPRILHDDPYRLTEIHGIGFKLADAAALHCGMKRRDPRRQAAAAVFVLKEAESRGHTALPIAEFGAKVVEALGEPMAGCEYDARVTERDGLLSRTRTLQAEERAAALIDAMRRRKLPEGLPCVGDGLAEDQQAALAAIQRSNVFCLLGSPGTGKTTLIKALVESNRNVEISLCAPTGKAAKRLEEATERRASTIHRLLEAGIDERTGKFRFRRSRDNRLSSKIVVCDEASMLDIRLFQALLEALTSDCRLILVGDTHQLPSVGPGRVLADLTKRGAIPYCELTQLKRHNPDLLIARNCAEIKAGRAPIVDNGRAKDFFFIETKNHNDADVADEIFALVDDRIPKTYGLDVNRDIIVLTALRDKGALSARYLNEILRRRLNGGGDNQFDVGDRVIQLSNNYELDVMNGDTGTVVGCYDQNLDRNLYVQFDMPSRVVTEDRDKGRTLNLAFAWALTVHKSQGSEWPWVVIPIHESQGAMVPDRAWLYTAISRAKQGCVLVGSRDAMRAAISRVRPQERCTRLAKLLEA